jgi:hypothetical protein
MTITAEQIKAEGWHTPRGEGRFKVEQRDQFHFAVLGPNPDAGKTNVSYSGNFLTVCTMDGLDEANMVAAALNAYAPAQNWPAE